MIRGTMAKHESREIFIGVRGRTCRDGSVLVWDKDGNECYLNPDVSYDGKEKQKPKLISKGFAVPTV